MKTLHKYFILLLAVNICLLLWVYSEMDKYNYLRKLLTNQVTFTVRKNLSDRNVGIKVIPFMSALDETQATTCPLGFYRAEKPVDIRHQEEPQCAVDNCECKRFIEFMSKLPEGTVRAAIYYLAHRTDRLILSLYTVAKYFGTKYPVIIFHEESFFPDIGKVQKSSPLDLFFQHVHFQVPDYIPQPIPLNSTCNHRWRLGYAHMCYFHSKGVYEHPIMWQLDYVLRLDDDSYFTAKVNYDLFEHMHTNHFTYGFSYYGYDAGCTATVWNAVQYYVNSTGHSSKIYKNWPPNRIFYNNFEISNLSIWRSEEYSDYINYIDKLGGIYHRRWGDAPIKTSFVTLYVPWNQVHAYFKLPYKHTRIRMPPGAVFEEWILTQR